MAKERRTVIVKVEANKFVKYRHVNNLPRFTQFLNRKFPAWRFMNVFDVDSKKQLASFTRHNPPQLHI